MKWTKQTATKELNALLSEIDKLRETERLSDIHTRWVFRVRRFLTDVFGEESELFINFSALSWQHEGAAMIGGPARPQESWNPQLGIARLNQEAYLRQLGSARGILLAAQDRLKTSDLSDLYEGKDSPAEASLLVKVINLAKLKLRKVVRQQPQRESDVQDHFESLLVGADVPFSRETVSIEYSSKTYKPDFVIEKADLAIDIKLCGKGGREKEIIAEINDDILAYKTKYGNLLFVIYDLGQVRDADKFARHFEDQEGVVVQIVKH